MAKLEEYNHAFSLTTTEHGTNCYGVRHNGDMDIIEPELMMLIQERNKLHSAIVVLEAKPHLR